MTIHECKLRAAVRCLQELHLGAPALSAAGIDMSVRLGTLDNKAFILTLSSKPNDLALTQTKRYEAIKP